MNCAICGSLAKHIAKKVPRGKLRGSQTGLFLLDTVSGSQQTPRLAQIGRAAAAKLGGVLRG